MNGMIFLKFITVIQNVGKIFLLYKEKKKTMFMFNNVRQQTNFRNIFDFIFDRNFENKIQFDRVDHKPE